MVTIIETIISIGSTLEYNIGVILVLSVLFACAWFANFCFSLFYNLVQIEDSFEWSRFWQGVLKAVAILVGLLSLTVVISALPTILVLIGVSISDNVANFLSMTVIVIPYASAIVYFVKEAIDTFRNILGSEALEDEDEIEING